MPDLVSEAPGLLVGEVARRKLRIGGPCRHQARGPGETRGSARAKAIKRRRDLRVRPDRVIPDREFQQHQDVLGLELGCLQDHACRPFANRESPKGSRQLPQRVLAALSEQPRLLHAAHVFVNPATGKPWQDVQRAVERARDKAGLRGVWIHDLRSPAFGRCRGARPGRTGRGSGPGAPPPARGRAPPRGPCRASG